MLAFCFGFPCFGFMKASRALGVLGRSFLLDPARAHSSGPRRIHLVCPLNGACTALALLLCEVLDAGCISDFSCLVGRNRSGDDERLVKNLDMKADSASAARDRWIRIRANLVVKNTISTETAALLTSNTRWAIGGDSRSGLFTHRILVLRDPVQQYLSVRTKPWCNNCGGFQKKLSAQDELVRRCIAARLDHSKTCPFDAVVFDFDLLADGGKALPNMLNWLGLHISKPSDLPLASNDPMVKAVHFHLSKFRARNVALSIRPGLVMMGNMRGKTLRPHMASARRKTYSCNVATRVRSLMPTLYDIYHPAHCAEPEVANETAFVTDWIGADGKRHSRELVRGKKQSLGGARDSRNISLVCDAFTDRDDTDCAHLPLKYQGTCASKALR